MQFVCEALESRRLFSTNIYTYHYDPSRSGLDATESTLTPANVNSTTFGLDFSLPVDGQVFAQPLYVSNLAIPGNGTHNVLFVATEADSVYAFDADTGAQLWKTSLLEAGETPGLVSVNNVDGDIGGAYSGVTGTPVIDPTTGTLYVVAKSQIVVNNVTTYIARLHALNILTGAEKFGGPMPITATVAGNSEGGTSITFNPYTQLQRGALALDNENGVVYVDWCSGNGNSPWHGWVMGYNDSSLAQVAVFCDTPNGPAEAAGVQTGAVTPSFQAANAYGGGIWMSGGGPIIDSSGNLYYAVGNGNFDTTLNAGGFPANGDYGDSFIKLTPDSSTSADPNLNGWGLSVTDYFTPSGQATLETKDLDLGSGGLLMLPNQPAAGSNELIGSDKSSNIYVINMGNMGKFDPSGDQAVQELDDVLNDPSAPVVDENGSYETPALFNNVVYFQGANDVMKAFTLSNGMLQTPPASSSTIYQFPGASPVVSANGTSNAVVWDIQNSAPNSGSLNAFDPSNLSTPIFSGSLNAKATTFETPTVADGHVYAGTVNSVNVYGLLPVTTGGTFIAAGGPAVGSYVADTDFSGGSTYSTTHAINTSADTTGAPASVYQTERWGNFTYTIPNLVAGNTYNVRLHFSENYWSGAGQRLFNVSINGTQVLSNFDIFAAAGAEFKAIVESFTATANASGQIVITFTGVKDNAKVDAIDVIPTAVTPTAPAITTNPQNQIVTAGQPASFTAGASGSPAPTVQWQVSSGGGPFTNITGNASATTTTLTLTGVGTAMSGNEYQAVFTNGVGSPATSNPASLTVNAAATGTFIDSGGPAVGSYVADTDFSGGSTYSTTSSINTSADSTGAPASVYQTERWGNFTYTVPNLVAGNSYSVLLHFAEIYWSSAGQRLFNVSINGTQVLSNFDIFAAAGAEFKAIVESFTATANASGQIVITFTGVKDNAKVDAIDVIPTAVTPTAPAITTNPQNQIVTAGQPASFTAGASGSPAPTVQWQVSSGGGPFTNITGNASATTTTLTLTGVGTAMSGNEYQAVFTNGVGSPATSNPASLTVNAAATGTFIDSGGPAVGSYVADTDFSGGSTYSTTSSINTSADSTGAPASVYQTERWGNFTYTVPNLVAGNSYSVLLHFAEIYWSSAGQRLFSVSINGTQVLSSFDIFAAAGGKNKAIVESFNAVANASGQIVITFTSVKDNAKVSAIDVVAA